MKEVVGFGVAAIFIILNVTPSIAWFNWLTKSASSSAGTVSRITVESLAKKAAAAGSAMNAMLPAGSSPFDNKPYTDMIGNEADTETNSVAHQMVAANRPLALSTKTGSLSSLEKAIETSLRNEKTRNKHKKKRRRCKKKKSKKSSKSDEDDDNVNNNNETEWRDYEILEDSEDSDVPMTREELIKLLDSEEFNPIFEIRGVDYQLLLTKDDAKRLRMELDAMGILGELNITIDMNFYVIIPKVTVVDNSDWIKIPKDLRNITNTFTYASYITDKIQGQQIHSKCTEITDWINPVQVVRYGLAFVIGLMAKFVFGIIKKILNGEAFTKRRSKNCRNNSWKGISSNRRPIAVQSTNSPNSTEEDRRQKAKTSLVTCFMKLITDDYDT